MNNNPTTTFGMAGGRVTGNLVASLRRDIAAGVFKSGELMPSVRQLTTERGVAHKTVYRALRQLVAEGWISAEPRRGYRVLARGNDPERGAPVAFVITPQTEFTRLPMDDLRQKMLAGIQRAAGLREWMLLSVECPNAAAEVVLERIRRVGACGVILDTVEAKLIAAVGRAGMPVVAIENWHEGCPVDSVVQDGFRAGFLAGSWLAGQGHRQVGWIGLAGMSRQGAERFGGAAAALAMQGTEMPSNLRLLLEDPGAAGRLEAVRNYLAGPERPGAILALWQGPTSLVVQASRELGLVPGKDFDMVGWSTEDGYPSGFRAQFAGGPVPPAVVWDVNELARAAVARLAARRADPGLPAVVMKIPTRLKLGD